MTSTKDIDNKSNGDASDTDDGNSSTSDFTARSTSSHFKLLLAVQKHWKQYTELLRQTITKVVVLFATSAARYPKSTLTSLTTFSLLMIGLGLSIKFPVRGNMNVIMSPVNSRPLKHSDWFSNEETSGFQETVPMSLYTHADGNNILDISISTSINADTETDYDVPIIVEALRSAFDLIDVVRNSPGYDELCEQGSYYEYVDNRKNEKPSCRTLSITKIWDHDRESFEKELLFYQLLYKNKNYDWLIDKLSAETFPDKTPIFHEAVIGHPVWETNATSITTDTESGKRRVVGAKSFLILIELPTGPAIEERNLAFQTGALERLGMYQDAVVKYNKKAEIDDENNNNNASPKVRIEYFSDHAIQVESLKSIYKDFFLIPILLIVLVAFTCSIFFNPSDPVKSRCILGICSLITITMSISSAFGILFLFGVPFTNLTQMILCVVFGVGLDDTFIITGEYFRMLAEDTEGANNNDSSKVANADENIINRIRKTMEEVGMSISLTTLTTVVAFILGIGSSSIPAVAWLCIYGATAIAIDFFYQITYFVAFLVLNERRVRENKRDCCFWIKVPIGDDDTIRQISTESIKASPTDLVGSEGSVNSGEDNAVIDTECDEELGVGIIVDCDASPPQQQRHVTERLMSWYADLLLMPQSKAIVMLFFLGMTAFSIYSISLFEQDFDIRDYIDKESHLSGWIHTTSEYTSVVRTMGVYFRNMNQSDPIIQTEMNNYIDDLTENLTQVGGKPPAACWFRDLQMLLEGNFTDIPPAIASAIPKNLDFLKKMNTNQQLEYLLSVPALQDVYGSDIVFAKDSNGDSYVKSSRCYFIIRNMDYSEVTDQMNLLIDQREITEAQPMNIGDGLNTDWPMFAFDYMFLLWESFLLVPKELGYTIITGIIAVTFAGFVFVPHRSAFTITLPMIVVTYINFLGMIRAVGIHINGLMYVLVVASIGLLVDFLMHILLRYYELIEKDHDIIGSSVLLSSSRSPMPFRDLCVKRTLETMGASVIQGGITTFVSVFVFVFGSTELFNFAFKALTIMIIVGIVHGVVLLPVVLSIFGCGKCDLAAIIPCRQTKS